MGSQKVPIRSLQGDSFLFGAFIICAFCKLAFLKVINKTQILESERRSLWQQTFMKNWLNI
jgi:hypothetical protein